MTSGILTQAASKAPATSTARSVGLKDIIFSFRGLAIMPCKTLTEQPCCMLQDRPRWQQYSEPHVDTPASSCCSSCFTTVCQLRHGVSEQPVSLLVNAGKLIRLGICVLTRRAGRFSKLSASLKTHQLELSWHAKHSPTFDGQRLCMLLEICHAYHRCHHALYCEAIECLPIHVYCLVPFCTICTRVSGTLWTSLPIQIGTSVSSPPGFSFTVSQGAASRPGS